MPSPFPGMDPYLEKPSRWSGFHHSFIQFLASAINAQLPQLYVARIGERLYVVQERRNILPDVAMFERTSLRPSASLAGGAASAVAVEEDLPVIVTVDEESAREAFIDIRRVDDQDQVVTTIEILSPTNKTPGRDGDQYLEKQRAVLDSAANLLEIDLLRDGRHTVAVPEVSLAMEMSWHYLVCLHRAHSRGRYEVWPIRLAQRLPRVRVPLANGDPDVHVDLQAVFSRCYAEGLYDRDLDYKRNPVPPLSSADAAWADALLRERGLRS